MFYIFKQVMPKMQHQQENLKVNFVILKMPNSKILLVPFTMDFYPFLFVQDQAYTKSFQLKEELNELSSPLESQ
jgi:hypothetical protein